MGGLSRHYYALGERKANRPERSRGPTTTNLTTLKGTKTMTTNNEVQKVLEDAERQVGGAPAPLVSALQQLLGELGTPIELAGFDAPGPVSFDERQKRKDFALQQLLGMGLEIQFESLANELSRLGFWAECGVSNHEFQLSFVPVRGTLPIDDSRGQRTNTQTFRVGVIASSLAGDVQVRLRNPKEIVLPFSKISPDLVLAGFKDFLRTAVRAKHEGSL
jgi:hypothetical protein